MRLAIISDLHADLPALEDALIQADHLDCERVVCAGDLVDGGDHAEEVIDLLRECDIPCVRGNHDRWACARPEASRLSDRALGFLRELPTGWDAVLAGVRVAVRHGTPRSDMQGIYPDRVTADDAAGWLHDARADVLVVGHTHIPFAVRTLSGGLLVNPGALARAADPARPAAWIYDPDQGTFVPGPPPGGGTFGVLELPARRFTVHRAADGVEVEIPRLTVGLTDGRLR